MASKAKSGGCKKAGRSSRKPAHVRYNNEKRWDENKEKRAAKRQRKLDKLKEKRNHE